MALGRDAILGADDRPRELVHVPEWRDPETGEDTVWVRGLSGKERDNYFASMSVIGKGGQTVGVNPENSTAKLAALCMITEDGEQLFSQRDVHALGEKSSSALSRVHEVASRLSGLTDEAEVEAEKDSPNGQSDDSTLILHAS